MRKAQDNLQAIIDSIALEPAFPQQAARRPVYTISVLQKCIAERNRLAIPI